MPKSIVVLCDGTSNTVEPDLSNVGKLYRCVVKDETQRVFYNPGVGTIGDVTWWSTRLQRTQAVLEQATGYGIDSDICDAYSFICREFEEDDRIYLFGFSRGAYTARIVAALIHMLGVFHPYQQNLVGYALQAYKQIAARDSVATPEDFERVNIFERFARARRTPIRFLGLWDTVSSLIVPGRNLFGLLPGLARLPFTRKNTSVETVRHAMAIDERRVMFGINRWLEGQPYTPNPYNPDDSPKPQDVKQVWFAGVHADVGGGYAETESGLSKIPLAWMIREAEIHGLKTSKSWKSRVVLGENKYPKDRFLAPDPLAVQHESLKSGWWLAELPCKISRDPMTGDILGFGWSLGARRIIATRDPLPRIHASVIERRTKIGYSPPNLPTDPTSYTVEA